MSGKILKAACSDGLRGCRFALGILEKFKPSACTGVSLMVASPTKAITMKLSRLGRIFLVSTLALGLQPSGRAQENLVNLYNWSNESLDPYGLEESIASILSPTSAVFYSEFTAFAVSNLLDNPFPTRGSLTGIFDTTPGATYEITFTTQGFYFVAPAGASMLFGNFTNNCTPRYNSIMQSYGPENFDYTVVATAQTTTMSFIYVTSPAQGGLSLAEFSVVEVPEISTGGLIGFGGCVFAIAQQGRRLFQKG